MAKANYIYHQTEGAPIKAWTKGVPIEDQAMAQLRNVAALPFIHQHLAASTRRGPAPRPEPPRTIRPAPATRRRRL